MEKTGKQPPPDRPLPAMQEKYLSMRLGKSHQMWITRLLANSHHINNTLSLPQASVRRQPSLQTMLQGCLVRVLTAMMRRTMMISLTLTMTTTTLPIMTTAILQIMIKYILMLTLLSPGSMRQRANTKKSKISRRGRQERKTKEPEPRTPVETRVVRVVRDTSPSPSHQPSTSPDTRTVSLLCRDGAYSAEPHTRASSSSSFSLLKPPLSLSSLPDLTSISSRTSFSYLTEDETDGTDEDEGELNIPSYHDLCYHIILRYQQDLQQGLLLNQGSPAQAEQLLLTNLALQHAPHSFPVLRKACVVLRGEDGTQHPLQVPLWDSGTLGPRGLHKASGSRKGLIGKQSTEKPHSSRTYIRK